MARDGMYGDGLLRAMNGLHRAAIRLSGGRLGWRIGRMPTVELHTVGRRTGRPRACLLTAPVHEDDRVVLVASRGGSDRHPAWYLNLVAHPDVELTTRAGTRRYRARTASPDEKAALWPTVAAAYPGYEHYRKRTTRDIPLVICEPVAPAVRPDA
ncbi:hypothetical protein ARHIZOSPH14_33670 [Agromyces rhizosphaerae]|uniref:Nitroreductase family deazaflavin-dependent oxidoreductase n=1 Tax=Agromyces rhizosphaerae TaxID=88374 RepID=A0A9W6CZI5_9MICO|nr:nitroreductase/quinone reductase family protein [Agromyces rhizosphaerae]GLI29125.1 hypothetical protein ARHIZOSPH14_33670 [Agromyces rhizosphaerae]